MTDLNPSTRALLDLGRAGDDPTDDAISRNRRSLSAKLGAAAVGTGIVAGSTSKAAAAAGAWSASKLLVVCSSVIIGGAVTFGVVHQQREAAPTRTAPGPLSASAQPQKAPNTTTAQSSAASDEPSVPGAAQPETTPPAPRTAPSSRAPAPRSIQEELELIRGAQRLLNRNDPRAALTLLTEHAQRFPSGALWEEREASRVFALCKLGNAPAARASAEAFVKRAPHSPFVERVRAACQAPAPLP